MVPGQALISRHNQSGFSMIELISVLVLLGIITAAAGLFVMTLVNSYAMSRQNADMSQKIQLAVKRIELEFEHISDIHSTGPDSIVYRIRSGDMAETEHVIGLDGATVKLGSSLPVSSGNILIDGVAGFSMNFFDRNGTITGTSNWSATGTWGSSNAADLYAIRMDLTLLHDSGNITISTTVYPRRQTTRKTGPGDWNSE